MNNKLFFYISILSLSMICPAFSHEYHVSPNGNDENDGSRNRMLKTISAAAEKAKPGDVITVHEGVYRERVDPPCGGDSDSRRILYRAAPGDKVVITGSERMTGWKKIQGETWTVVIPNSLFGDFNPYADLIHGDWFYPKGRKHHTGAVYLKGHWLTEAAKKDTVMKPVGKTPFWFAVAGASTTTIWAQFDGVNPNRQNVEINVRRTVFYPSRERINFLTVQGFILEHAATPWSPPTAEQIGLIGTHWSKGWIIEDNIIRYSTCAGVALGKYGDQWDNTSQNAAAGYVKTIERGLAHGWSRENIGHHIVRNNEISNCEQAGIVGSLGAVFSTICGNDIHDIHVRHLFTGSEMAGIKIHAAVDTTIRGNRIYRTVRGIWLDWMAQGTRVTGNLLYDNGRSEDLYVEVNHGPFLVDNNVFLSKNSLKDTSQGGAYVHNLIAGRINLHPDRRRLTPYLKPHGTAMAGQERVKGGDDRFFNNILVAPASLAAYDKTEHPVWIDGNVYLKGAKPSALDKNAITDGSFDPEIRLTQKPDGVYLSMNFAPSWAEKAKRQRVTSERLGRALLSDMPFVGPDGNRLQLGADYFGRQRDAENLFPGPFSRKTANQSSFKVWPVTGGS